MLLNIPCRIVLLVINTVAFILGVILLAVGAIMVWGRDAVHGLLSQFLTPLLQAINAGSDVTQITELLSRILSTTAPIGMTLFCLGAFCAIIAVIGYCGACCNYKCVLYVYAALIGVLALVMLILVIVYYSDRNKFGDRAVQIFARSVKNYVSMEENTMDSLIVGLLQPLLHCCGVDNSSEFSNMSKSDVYNGRPYSDLQYPIPCCRMNNKYVITGENCPNTFNNENSYINQSCRVPLRETFLNYMNNAAYGLIATCGILAALVVFTIFTVKVDVI